MKIEITEQEHNLLLQVLLFSCSPQLNAHWEDAVHDEMLVLAKKLNTDNPKIDNLVLDINYDASDQSTWTIEDVADHKRCEDISNSFNLEINR